MQLLSWLKGAQYYSHLDPRDGYFHVPIVPKEDIYETIFSYRYGKFKYLVMLFGLINSPSIFKRLVYQILFDLFDFCVVVYLDDILVFSYVKNNHMYNLNAVFKRF